MNNRQFAIVAAITFIVGMIWLAADVIFNTKASIPISPKLQSALEPISPVLNPRILEVIEAEVMETSPEVNTPEVNTLEIIPESDNQSTESAEEQL